MFRVTIHVAIIISLLLLQTDCFYISSESIKMGATYVARPDKINSYASNIIIAIASYILWLY